MVQDIISKADCHSAYQNESCFLYGTQRLITVFTKAPPLDPTRSQPDPVRPVDLCLLKVHLHVSFHLCLGLPSRFFPSGLPIETL
jgi:hypothetical protein